MSRSRRRRAHGRREEVLVARREQVVEPEPVGQVVREGDQHTVHCELGERVAVQGGRGPDPSAHSQHGTGGFGRRPTPNGRPDSSGSRSRAPMDGTCACSTGARPLPRSPSPSPSVPPPRRPPTTREAAGAVLRRRRPVRRPRADARRSERELRLGPRRAGPRRRRHVLRALDGHADGPHDRPVHLPHPSPTTACACGSRRPGHRRLGRCTRSPSAPARSTSWPAGRRHQARVLRRPAPRRGQALLAPLGPGARGRALQRAAPARRRAAGQGARRADARTGAREDDHRARADHGARGHAHGHDRHDRHRRRAAAARPPPAAARAARRRRDVQRRARERAGARPPSRGRALIASSREPACRSARASTPATARSRCRPLPPPASAAAPSRRGSPERRSRSASPAMAARS
jgi:hypothetical protein